MKVQTHRDGTSTIRLRHDEVRTIRALLNLADIGISDIQQGKNPYCRLEDSFSVGYYARLKEQSRALQSGLRNAEDWKGKVGHSEIDLEIDLDAAGVRWAVQLQSDERRQYLPTQYRLNLGFDAS